MDIEARLTSLERSKEDTLKNLDTILGVKEELERFDLRTSALEELYIENGQRIRRLEKDKEVQVTLSVFDEKATFKGLRSTDG